MNPLLDHTLHFVELAGIVVTLWRANRAINRYLDVLELFPPHLHVNGNVVYPKNFEPGQVHHVARAGAAHE